MLHELPPLFFLSSLLVNAPLPAVGDRQDSDKGPALVAKGAMPEWQVREGTSFDVKFLAGDEELAEQVAECAEKTRAELYRNWFAVEQPADWNPKCQIFLHASSASYAAATDHRAASSGYSVTHSSRGRIVSQQIDVLQDGSDLLHAVLPHELAHVLLANRFVRRPLPLWAEEGLAVLAETPDIRNAHVKNLDMYARRGKLFTAQELMGMNEYPPGEQRGVFYAQSVSLVEFMISRRGTPQFMDFLNLAPRRGQEQLLKRMYGVAGFQELHQDWMESSISVNKLGMSR